MSGLVPEKTHAVLGASVASRWMACPGSVQLIQQVPEEQRNGTSIHAQTGTAAHALAELALKRGVDPSLWVGMTVEGIEVDDEMADFVRVYVEHCRTLMERGLFWIERKFNLAALNPPAPMFGTADFVAIDHAARMLHVCDLKYGQGVVVEVAGNKQLRYYGLGALLSLTPAEQSAIDEVTITIVQPRAAHADGAIRSETLSVMDLLDFAGDLMAAARDTIKPDAPLAAGSHCRWCPASAICPAQREHAMEIAQADFAVVEEYQPPAPATLDDERLGEILDKLPILESWIKAVYAHAEAKLRRGEPVPGFKIVERRPTRRFTDIEEAEQIALDAMKGDASIYEPMQLKSVAQIEKLIGKKKFAEVLGHLVEKKSSGSSMVPVSDSRQALNLSAGDEFTALPSGDITALPEGNM